MGSMTRLRAGVFSILVLGAALFPVIQNFRDEPQDSFPLSWYPMFSKPRAAERWEYYLVGLDAEGNRSPIHYRYAGRGGMNQVRRQIRRQMRGGGAEELCREVAGRVAESGRTSLRDVVTVQAVRGKYRLDDYFQGNKTPVEERIYASCPVPREGE